MTTTGCTPSSISLSFSRLRNRLSFTVLALSGAALAALIAAPAHAAEPEKTEITIGVGPGWGAGGHAIIAAGKGYFAEAGLEKVNLKTFPAGMMQLEAMISGGVDLANATQAPVLTLRSNGLPVVVLSSLAVVDRTMGVVAKSSANIKQPKDLEGKKLGLLKGSGAEHMLQLLCKDYEVDCGTIQIVNLPPPAQLASLSSGVIDGMVTWQPWIHKAQEKEQVDLLHSGRSSYFESNKGEDRRIDFTRAVLASTENFVKKNPATIAAILQAYEKAQDFVADPANYDEVVRIYSEYFQEDTKLNEILLKDNDNTLALDDNYLGDMEEVRNFLSSTGRLRKDVDIKKLTAGAALAQQDGSLVSDTFK